MKFIVVHFFSVLHFTSFKSKYFPRHTSWLYYHLFRKRCQALWELQTAVSVTSRYI